MDPIELIALMAASLRAGKGGPEAEAWRKAINEAMYGFSTILANEANVRAQFKALLPPVPDPERRVEPVGGLVVPV